MADMNVHFQNSVLLAKSLVNNNVPFEQHVSNYLSISYPWALSYAFKTFQFYADEDHFLDGVKTHLYTTVTRFLERCLYKPEISDESGEITYEYKKGHLVASFKERDEDELIGDFAEESNSDDKESF